MKARLKNRVIAESDDIVAEGGYHYFPISRGAHGVAGESAEDRTPITTARMAFSSTTC